MLNTIWIVLGITFSMVSFFPLINSTHWVFRIFDFIRLQLCAVLLALLLVAPFLLASLSVVGLLAVCLAALSFVYQLWIILPYFPKRKNNSKVAPPHHIITLCINVQQENQNYDKLIELVKRVQPDILLTSETNKTWEQKLEAIEDDFSKVVRVPKENRYGMHFYTKLEVKDVTVHHLISSEHPSIEVNLYDSQKNEFIFWGIHPPPPSPTEKPSSKQKDAELMQVAKIVRERTVPILVSGDFNNVAWSRASKLFSKISNLKDARISRGIYSTFPAKLRAFGFPIDLLFHANTITITNIEVLAPIGSDHLPLLFMFHINSKKDAYTALSSELKQLANQKISAGKEAAKEEN